MKLLFVFTGGTIGSTLGGGFISADKSKPRKLIEAYRERYGLDAEIDSVIPYEQLSENNDGDTLKRLADCVLCRINRGYDGVIVTHGTDTLQYSAAVLGYALGGSCVPVVLVSSNLPIEDSCANGLENLRGAIEFIKNRVGGGVWVSYKNSGENVKIHRATRLLGSTAFSDRVESAFGCFMGSFSEDFEFIENPEYSEAADEIPPLSAERLTSRCKSVMRIVPYPAMKYPEIPDGLKYILHESYHSGTIDASSADAVRFFTRAKEKGVRVFLTGAADCAAYDSTRNFDSLGICRVVGGAPPAMLVKLMLSASSGLDPMRIMKKSLCGDFSGSGARG